MSNFLSKYKSVYDVFLDNWGYQNHFVAYLESLMRQETLLPTHIKEMIFAYVSGLNGCGYCKNIHVEISKKILSENKNFKAPNELKFNLPGKAVIGEMNKILDKLYNEKIILDHGMTVAKELAHVLSGGDTTIDKTLSEDDLFKLELDACMKLIEMKQTQDRIKHTLSTGKPLVN